MKVLFVAIALLGLCSCGSEAEPQKEPELVQPGQKQVPGSLVWTDADRLQMIESCVNDSRLSAGEYPELTKEFCTCTMERISAKMSYSAYLEETKKPLPSQYQNIMPLIQDCVDVLTEGMTDK